MIDIVKILILLILFSFTTFAANKASCETDSSECSIYCQLNDALKCSSSNYLTKFGHKYCRQFLDNNHRFSVRGQLILSKIRSCLISTLKNQETVTCGNVESFAMESHYTCYIESGFCDLPKPDALDVMWIIRTQFFNKKMQPYFERVLRACRR
jgi:hypothetical protein